MDTQLASLDHNDPLELAAGYLTWLKAAPEPEDEVDFRPLLQVLRTMVKTRHEKRELRIHCTRYRLNALHGSY